MVSADNLHLDVLQLIFEHVPECDIASVALVSRSFFSGAEPHLYKRIIFTEGHAKKYLKTVSPFAVIATKRPYAAVHVQTCHINAIPVYKGQPHHEFLLDSIRALDLCHNLTDFRLAINVLPTFIRTLLPKTRLRSVSFNGSLTEAQVIALTTLQGNLESVHVEHGSWCLMNAFPGWMKRLGPCLTNLSINLTPELNANTLEESLKELPNLLALRVTNCMRIDHHDVLRLVRHTPLLESLSLTTWEHPSTDSNTHAPTPHLRQLTLDSRNAISSMSLIPLWSGIIANTKRSNAPLSNITFQLAEKVYLEPRFIDELLDAHANTLTALKFKNCTVSSETLKKICKRCPHLEVLRIPIHLKRMESLIEALKHSNSLHTLIDEREKHSTENIAPSLKLDDAKQLLSKVPNLKTIESETKRWSAIRGTDSLTIALERKKPGSQHQLHRFC